jgi:homocysteine S-methyltransferase
VLINCVAASRTLPFVRELAGLGVPFGAYANAGDESEGLGWNADPQHAALGYEKLARSWIDAGATLVGGCCGTGPAHIARLAARRC